MGKQRRIQFGITLPPDMVSKIDEDRGLVTRTRYIELLIRRGMSASGKDGCFKRDYS